MEEQKQETLKQGFFKKLWNSIVKIEKYPDMAAEGLGRAFIYMCKIIAILAIVICLGRTYQAYQMVQEGTKYLKNEFPEFSYKDGILDVQANEKWEISENDSYMGKAIIDTKVDKEETINQYINEIEQTGSGIIVLKDKVILKNENLTGTISYNYQEILGQMGINEFNKQKVIDYTNSSQMISFYISIFITIFIYAFMMYLLTTISNAVFLSVFGYIATLLIKIKMRYVAIFNMSVYALTLSTILTTLYSAVNIFINFNMEYFQVMYISVATIYLVAAIFILKTEFIKKQEQMIKLAEAQELIRRELEQKEQEEKDEKERQERQKKDKEDEKKQEDNNKEGNDVGQTPEGSNA